MNLHQDILRIELMLKATPHMDAGRRYVYLEASREAVDQQGEVVLAKALEDSAPHFLRFGNIDIDHMTIPAVAQRHNIADPQEWEIGRPVDVRVDGKSTFVKAELYQGDTPLAGRANMVWDSMTKLTPPKPWYPSVGGSVLNKTPRVDAKSGAKVDQVSKVRWTNIALSAHPVNQHVAGVTTIPFGVLAKCWTGEGLDMAKALEAGYGTDSATLTGGAALRQQSLDGAPKSYFDFRDKLSALIMKGQKPGSRKELEHLASSRFSLSPDEAAEWVGRFLRDLSNKQRRSQ